MNHAKAIGQRNGRWAGGVVMAVGAAFAAALIGLANAPVAGADEGSAVDTAVDNFLQGIANAFPVEVEVNEGTFLDPDAIVLSPGLGFIEPGELGFNLAVNTAFQPEGPIDVFFDQLFPAQAVPAQALDIQVSIGGMDLFPTAGNTASAFSGLGDIAIAIGNGADANATGGIGDFAFVDGANSTAEAGVFGGYDSAVVFGSDSTAEAVGSPLGFGGDGTLATFDLAAVFGSDSTADAIAIPPLFPTIDFGIPATFDLAAVFGNMLTATAFGIGDVVIAP